MTSAPDDAASPQQPAVSVIIPTVGRPTLGRAVNSALEQSYPPVEVLVVYDLPEVPMDAAFGSEKVSCHATGGKLGPNAARGLGVGLAKGDAIAFLDDDDYWCEGKLAAQVLLLNDARRDGQRSVVSTRGWGITTPDGELRFMGPKHTIAPGQSIADYLFVRHTILPTTGMGPSSLLVDAELLHEVPLPRDLRLHEDWDWMLSVGERPRVRFSAVSEPQMVYYRRPATPANTTDDHWRRSFGWARANRHRLTRREYGDLLLTVSMAIAVSAGARIAAIRIFLHAQLHGRPGLPATLFGLGMIAAPPTLRARLVSAVDRVQALARPSARR